MKGVIHFEILDSFGHQLHKPPGSFFGDCIGIKIGLGFYNCFNQCRVDIVPLGNFSDETVITCVPTNAISDIALLSFEESVFMAVRNVGEMDSAIFINIAVNICAC